MNDYRQPYYSFSRGWFTIEVWPPNHMAVTLAVVLRLHFMYKEDKDMRILTKCYRRIFLVLVLVWPLSYQNFFRKVFLKMCLTIYNIKKKGLNKFFVPINITNFDFSPYKIKLNVFILAKNFILFLVLNGYNFNAFLTFFEHNMNI